MFDNILRKLRELERGVKVPVSIPLDDNGHCERRCPSDECSTEFKIHFDDWKDKVRDAVVYCPICRHEAPSDSWNTSEQQEHFNQVAVAHLMKEVNRAFAADSRRFNASQPRNGFIRMSMSYRPGPPVLVLPLDGAEALRQQFTCELCGCRYSSVGAAFFCPACGHNSATSTFSAAVVAVRTSVANLARIKAAVCDAAGEDAATDAVRQILENGLVKLVASFQRLAEALFDKLPNAAAHPPRKNLFQNLADSSAHWRAATGKGYEDLLGANEQQELSVFFQQRHLLAHKEGMVDAEYLRKSGDSTYRIGQKLQVKEAAVLRLADICEQLAGSLRRLVESFNPIA